ncbi:MAG TPA: Na+/H+ antiporter subunit E [Thermoleophilaceae bacterium]|nr:Na+/H+ antiporter subunit E [Thermoleophilaceae bacterium]
MPARLCAWWIALAALWLLLVDNVKFPELMTGAAAALIGSVAAEVVHSQSLVRLRVKPSWARYAWRPLVRVFPETGRVLLVLLRQLVLRRPAHGEFRVVPFRPGRPDGGHDMTRRALAKAAGSFAPNTYVVGVDDEREVMLVHQLEPSDDASELDPLELG